jgi:hypothetical protein
LLDLLPQKMYPREVPAKDEFGEGLWRQAIDIAAGRHPPPVDWGLATLAAWLEYPLDLWPQFPKDPAPTPVRRLRRVWRGQRWRWLSDAREKLSEVETGKIFAGDILAEYVLGGGLSPDRWLLVGERSGVYLARPLEGIRRRDGRWDLCWPSEKEVLLTVPDPLVRSANAI